MKEFDWWQLLGSLFFVLGLYCLYAGVTPELTDGSPAFIRTGLVGLGLGIVGSTLYKFFDNVGTIARNSGS